MDYAWLAPVLPAGAFFFNVIVARQLGRRKHSVAATVAIAAILGAFVVFLVVFGDALANLGSAAAAEAGQGPQVLLFANTPWFTIGPWQFYLTMSVDWLSIMMLGVVSFLSSFIQIYSLGYMRGDDRFWWFFTVMSLFCAAMLGLVLAYDFLLLYMCWELVGLCSYLLIGFWYQERDNAEAAKKAFITTRIGDVGFFIGIALLFLQTNTLRMDKIFSAIGSGQVNPAVVTVAGILVFMGAIGKSGQFPLHVWLPDAMAGPTPVSALVHSATMVAAGVYLVGRTYPLFAASPITLGVIAVIGTITLFFAATIALTQRDIKRILAYSTVSQLGYMIMALGVGAYTAGLFHLYTHAFFKALLFLGAGSVIHSLEPVLHGTGKSANDIFWMGGLRKRMPVTFVTFLIGALSLSGIFPLSGFWSKDEILLGALDAGAWVALILGLVTAFLTAFYMFRAIYLTFFGDERWREAAPQGTAEEHGAHHPEPHESPWVMLLALVVIAVPAAIAGWVNLPVFFPAFAEAIHAGAGGAEEFNVVLAVLGLLAGLLGIGLATIMYWKPIISPVALGNSLPRVYRLLYNKYYVDELYQWIIDRIVLAVGGLLSLFDRKVISEVGVDGTSWLTGRFGWWLRFIQTGRIYTYAFAFVVGIVIVGFVLGVVPNM